MKTEGDRFIYIYGELDTWSATGVPVSDQVDAHWIILKGQDHGGARIKNMTEAQRQELVNALEEWLNIDLD